MELVEKKKKIKKHHHDFFYKYLTFDGFYDMLQSGHLKYSSTKIFNDPFDMQFEIVRPYDEAKNELGQIYKAAFEDAKKGLENEKLKSNTIYHSLFTSLMAGRDRLHLPEVEEKMKKLIDDGDHSAMFKTLLGMNSKLNDIMDSVFVFCVSKNANDPLMWSHYTQGHSGVVVKLACVDNEDHFSPLCEATEVFYDNDIPHLKISELFTEETKIGKNLERVFMTKGKCWAYENEWRHVVKKDGFRGAKYVYEKYKPEEISAVYFGCKMSDENKRLLSDLIRWQLPTAEVHQAVKNQETFSLKFSKLF